MPAKRKEITDISEGRKHVARFRYPRRVGDKRAGLVVRFDLGSDADYRANLAQLNRIFLEPATWHNPPATTSGLIRDQWLSGNRIKVKGDIVSKGGEVTTATADELAALMADLDAAEKRVKELEEIIEQKDREIEHWSGKKLQKKDYVTLRKACDDFLASYTDKDADSTRTIKYDLEKFVAAFGPKITVDALEGQESKINSWLCAKKNKKGEYLSGGRRNQIRLYVLKMLVDAHVTIDRKKIKAAPKADITEQRGGIRWLERPQAEAVAQALASPWREMFSIQCAVGLRPDELLTLTRSNFNSDFSQLTLAKLGKLTLKRNKSRTIPIPAGIRPLIEWRARTIGDVLFPEPETGLPWSNPKNFNRRFNYALGKAAEDANKTLENKITVKMDCRIGRRTCCSLLLQGNVSAEKIAKLAGNTPGMILSHYGDPDLKKLDLNQNVVGCGKDDKAAEEKAVS